MKKLITTIFVCFLFTFIVGCNSLEINHYTITFNSNGGSEVSSITQDYNTQVTKPDDPTKTGYTFGGWYSDSDLTQEYTFSTMPKENITLYAKWNMKQYTIIFNSNGGSEVSSITQDYNTQVTKPDDPTKTGYTFGGWYSDSDLTQEYTFSTMPKENITLYAKWLQFSTEGLKYTLLRDNTYSVSGYNGSDHNVIIPSVYKGRLVTAIYDYAFAGIKSSTSITIPSSVTKIGKYAFYEATGLSNINVDTDNPIFSSKDGVLLNKNQTTIIVYPRGKNEITYTIPNSITAIGNYAFLKAINLTSVIFEEGNQLTRIGDFAFSGATSLTSITIPDSVITIGKYAFSGVTSLTSITIPNSVTTIGNCPFFEATSLTSINVDDCNPVYSSKDGVLFDKYQTTIIVYPINKEEATYTIPNSVTTIGNSAFSRTINLTTVIFEEGSQLTCIGLHAFYEATNLTSIQIPKNVTTIGSYAFYETTSLTSIKIPSRVTYIGDSAFQGTTSLSSVIFEEGSQLTTIGSRAFSGTVSLTTVIFEEGSQLITIGDYAFEGARSLSSITFPKSVTIIGNDVFLGAISLTSINVDADNPVYSSIDGILFNKNQTLLIIYPVSKNETIYTIPNSVTTIGDRTFEGATSLTSITIPKSVTTIGDFAFKGATSLTNINVDVDNSQYSSVDGVLFNKNQTLLIIYPASKNETIYTIPNCVTTIGDLAFEGATSLTSITISKSVTTIGNFAFYEGTNLTTVIFEESSQLTSIGSRAFSGATSLTSIIITATIPPSLTDFGFEKNNLKIYVPSDFVSLYKTAWTDYASIIYPIQ